ncbi:GrdX family protein [uncultured Ezakiella sp.]|uniref:GrdX family protein n=1 Tax=uncultured Ezakiella sp. TaxID=1637529 RepID=UPI0025F6BC2C|nr:GrdX family protein [uncultured Ezakiella sp.]
MKSKNIIVTNNPYVRDKFENEFNLVYIDDNKTYMEVLTTIRDMVHKGYKLLTHPLSGSVKPNETPYKSVMLEEGSALDSDSLMIIEGAIQTMKKFQNNEATPNWPERVHDDFRVVDLSLMENTVYRLGHF